MSRLLHLVFLVFKVQADAGIEAPVPEVLDWLAKQVQVGAHYSKKIIPSKVAVRHSRGPIFFKFVRVDYDKVQGRLKLSKGAFAGHEVKSGDRDTGEEKENTEEYAESVVGSGKEESYLAGKENGQLFIVYDNFYPIELLKSALEMVDLCQFNLSLVRLFQCKNTLNYIHVSSYRPFSQMADNLKSFCMHSN